MEVIKKLEKEMMRMDIPDFSPGDTVKVHVKIREGEKTRIQVFQGVVISRKNNGAQSSFTVRKISYGVGRGEGLSVAFAHHRPDRTGHQGPRAQGQDILSAQTSRKSRQNQGKKIRLAFGSIIGADSGALPPRFARTPPLASLTKI